MIRVECQGEEGELFQELAAATVSSLALKGEAYIEVDFVTEDEIRQINASNRGVDRVTDVLSFPALSEIKEFSRENYPYECNGDGEVMLGSIIICSEVAKAQAIEYGHSEKRESCYLFTHGLMHLLGYDHETEDEKKEMRTAEEKVLSACGIKREE